MSYGPRPSKRGPPPRTHRPGPKPASLPAPPGVVHEDDAILVLEKPPGWLVTRTPGSSSRTLTDWVLARARRNARGGESPKLKAASDLDPLASGLIVFAKNPEAFEDLKRQFRTKRPHRIALAIVRGHPRPEGAEACVLEGTVRKSLARGRPGPGPARPADKPAVTHFRLVRGWKDGAALRLRLETSFPGQVEDHLRSIGCELVRKRPRDLPPRLSLHLGELGFRHPVTGAAVRYSSRPPQDMAKAFGDLPPSAREPTRQNEPAESWDHVAEWYDAYMADRRSDHFDEVILPGVLRLLEPTAEEAVLDVACGQGELCRELAKRARRVVGIDASEALLDAARSRRGPDDTSEISYLLRDARDIGAIEGGPFDGATCIMAIMNIDPIAPVFEGVARALRDGGRLVLVLLHPAFRQPGRTAWAWTGGGPDQVQERRIRGYLSESAREIVMNPGSTSESAEPIVTTTHNRPLQSYARALAGTGLAIDAIEEWASRRESEPGPRAGAENLARAEIPMFLAIRAVKLPGASGLAQEPSGA